MPENQFVPLSYYISRNLFGFIDLPEGLLDNIGISGSGLETRETLGEIEETFEETFIDEMGNEVISSWTQSAIERETDILLTIANSQELAMRIPGIDEIELVITATDAPGASPFTVVITFHDDGTISCGMGISFRLRISSEILKPMIQDGGGDNAFAEDSNTERIEIEIGEVNLGYGSDGFYFDASAGFEITQPVMIGDTGVIIDELTGLTLNLTGNGSKPENSPDDWKGLYIGKAKVYIPDLMQGHIEADGLGIGSGGLYGRIEYRNGDIEGEILGMEGSITSIALEFVQSIPTEAAIGGRINLPFFDEPIDVEIGIDFDGGFTLILGGEDGLYTFTRENLLEMEVESIGVELEEGVATFKLSGSITPLFGGIDWPSFQLEELSIDSEGNVKYEGGWIDLPDQYSLDFHGFQMEITQLGFGKSDDGGKWIGFSGALNLVEGLTAGASVEGLRITWYDDGRDTSVTLEGVGVELEVPDVLRFQGAVSYRTLDVAGEKVHRFDGDITLDLIALDMQIDATLVIGSARGDTGAYTFFAIYLGVELPTGIPLWSTGLGLYGVAGLFALQMEPDKKEDEEWYGMGPGEGWFKRPEIGVADLTNKWINRYQSLALGAGVTIGTVADNGYIFSGKVLLVIVFPGPIILIEGKASLLKERSSLDEEPVFRALAVLDGRAGTFLVGLDAQYKYDEDEGRLIDIHGSAEMFFSLSDLSAWHLYLGEMEPREKRIRAEIISFIEANAYFMLDARQLAMGAWIGYDGNWTYGPVRIILEAWLEGNVLISWKPGFFHGDVWLHGALEISIFGIGIGITADARFACDVYDPFHILAEFRIVLTLLFWDLDIGFTLEWGPEPIAPPLPLPLKEIAVDHLKMSTSWPLPRGELLLPNYDREGFRQEPDVEPASLETAPPPDGMPIVPMDCRPCLTFGRCVHDDAWVGDNPQPPDPEWERIGDPEKDEGPVRVRYGLKAVTLDKWDIDLETWATVARNVAIMTSAGPPQVWELETNEDGVRDLAGSWAPLPSDNGESVAQTKLMLWSKTPFDYTRRAGSVYDEWFTDRFSEYPCLPIPLDREFCYDFQGLSPELSFASPWTHPAEDDLVLYWETPNDPTITNLDRPVEGRSRALCFIDPGRIVIHLPRAAKSVRVIFITRPDGSDGSSEWQRRAKVSGYDSFGKPVDTVLAAAGSGARTVEIANGEITHIAFTPESAICLVAVCITVGPSAAEIALREKMERHLSSELAHWSQTGDVLEPHSTYRLKVETTIQVKGEGELRHYQPDPFEQTEFAYFRTGGPPGLTRLTLPAGASLEAAQRNERNELIVIEADGNLAEVAEEALGPGEQLLLQGGLNDLTPYVHQTIPATVPAPGEKPPLPRPVYRAYDVGVEFNENYVDLMYRLARRDLGLYLYDSNNRPVRDAQGRLIVVCNQWGETERLFLTESEERWITVVNASECVSLDPEIIPHGNTLISAAEGQVLEPDTLYEARLVPLLLHEDFSAFEPGTSADGPSGTLDGWRVIDEGTIGGASHWEVVGHPTLEGDEATADGSDITLSVGDPSTLDLSVLNPDHDVILLTADTERASGLYRIVSFDNTAKTITVDGEPSLEGGTSSWKIPQLSALIQTSRHWGGSAEGPDPVKPGTTLLRNEDPALPSDHPDQPSNWSDYRFSAYLRSADFDALGVVFRYCEDGGQPYYYRFSMDRKRTYRRLVRVIGEMHTILAEDDFVFSMDQDYLITVEAVGSSLRVYQDGTLIFAVTDDAILQGSVGLHCWANQGARFSDLRVDDYRREAPVAYRFKFTTSRFTNFFHHLHSFQDETWLVDLSGNASPPTGGQIDAWFDETVELGGAEANALPSKSEARAYESMAQAVLGPAALQNPPQVEVTWVVGAGMDSEREALAFLVRSPEPIDWKRTAVELLRTDRWMPLPSLPGTVKLTDVTFGTTQPNEETVTLLLREATDLSGHRIEYCQLPEPIYEPVGDPVFFMDEFEDDTQGLLFHEEFGPNALDHYEIVDEGRHLGSSSWSVREGHLVQTGRIFGGVLLGRDPQRPGTMALTGSDSWANVRIRTTLRSETDDALGVVFRHRDADNYYRFSMDAQRRYRRLIKKVNATVSVLWEDKVAYTRGHSYDLVIDAYQDRLLGILDDVLIFHVQDADLGAGRIGFYCWHNRAAHFEGLDVERLESDPLLWQPAFSDLKEVSIVDEEGATEGPSAWAAENGALTQTAIIYVPGDILWRSTYALGGRSEWRDVHISVRLRSDDNDGIGLMFRYQDGDNYYRFSMDHERSFKRLVKVVDGALTVLWQDNEPYTVGQTYELAVRAMGHELRGHLDGEHVFTVSDGDLKHGRIGLYCWANDGARFERVVVVDQTRRVGRWRVVDEGTNEGPSVWKISAGALVQTSNIFGGSRDGRDPVKPGTFAVAGDPAWTDYRLTARLRSDDNDAIGLMFRFVDEDNYYRLSLDNERRYRRLTKKEQGVVTALWEDDGAYTLAEAFTLTVEAVGSRLTGYMGDVRMFEVTDSTHACGQVGLYCWGNTGARFEEVEVNRPALDAFALFRDRFAEGDASGWTIVDAQPEDDVAMAPSEWVVEEGAFHQCSNIWTRPNDIRTLSKKGTHAIAGDPAWTDVVYTVRLRSQDDDAIGVLFRYADEQHYYRFSMDHERGYRRLVKNIDGIFHLLWEDAFGYEIDRTYEFTIVALGPILRCYLDGIPVFVVEDSDLERGCIGLYCWANQNAWFSNARIFPAAMGFNDWLLNESFDFPVVGRWIFVDEGDREGPSQWEVTDGELRQTSNISGGALEGSVADKPGTCALAGDSAWQDYRFIVRLRSDGDSDAIGAVFRYRDENNYYRFSMDHARRNRRLIKKVADVVTVLWEDDEQYVVGRDYVLTLDCVGESLKGYLDGLLLFDEADADLAEGCIGLYCWGNRGARFAEVQVAAPIWCSYYSFGREAQLPAGTRMRVHSGNEMDVSPEEIGVVRRYLASLDATGQIRFPAGGVDLRLVGPHDIEGHGRRFLPEEVYVPAEGRLLRKADETGFFIVAFQLDAGQYRLKMNYRRKNQDKDPNSQVFTQAGKSDEEAVIIDIPWQTH